MKEQHRLLLIWLWLAFLTCVLRWRWKYLRDMLPTAAFPACFQAHQATSMRWSFWYRDTVYPITWRRKVVIVIIDIVLLLLAYGHIGGYMRNQPPRCSADRRD